MPKAYFLKRQPLEQLKTNIPANAAQYTRDEPWLSAYFGSDAWALPSRIELPDFALRAPTSKAELHDLENTKVVYSALKHLTPLQAADERLWAYLGHVTHWRYMRQRWPVEQYLGGANLAANVVEHYFFTPDRSKALTRNGLARLWWYGYSTYDEGRDDPFELTGVLLKNLDVTQSVVERTFSRNRDLTRAFLSVLRERELKNQPFYRREEVRPLAQYLVRLGGVTIVDALSYEEMHALISRRVDAVAPSIVVAGAPAGVLAGTGAGTEAGTGAEEPAGTLAGAAANLATALAA